MKKVLLAGFDVLLGLAAVASPWVACALVYPALAAVEIANTPPCDRPMPMGSFFTSLLLVIALFGAVMGRLIHRFAPKD